MAEKKQTSGETPQKKSRYERIKEILDEASGGPVSPDAYQGHGAFWNLPLAAFLEVEIYGFRMIAPAQEGGDHRPFAPPPPEPPDRVSFPPDEVEDETGGTEEEGFSCCHGAPIPPRGRDRGGSGDDAPPCAGRGARSWLVKGLKGDFPFDCSKFPPLPWGDKATRLSGADISLIESWIDDCCPETDEERPAPPDKPWQEVCVKDYPVSKKDPNTHKQAAGELKHRKNVWFYNEEEKCKLRYAIAQLKELNRFPDDNRSYNAWAQIHADHCQHGWEQFLPWHRIYLYLFQEALEDIVPDITLPYWDWTHNNYNGGIVSGGESGLIPSTYQCWLSQKAYDNLKAGGEVGPVLSKLQGIISDGTDPSRLYGSAWELFVKARLTADDYVNYNQPVVNQLVQVNPVWHPFRYPGMFYPSAPGAPPQPTNWKQAYCAGGTACTPQAIKDTGLQHFHHHYPRQEDLEEILNIANWRDFGGGHVANASFGMLSQNPHNTGHIWLGGSNPFFDLTLPNGTIPTLGPAPMRLQPQFGDMFYDLLAVYDPMFWSHHSNVDRMWYEWQQRHPNVNPDDPTDVLLPFGYKVEQSLNAEKLGYNYMMDSHLLSTNPTQSTTKIKTDKLGVDPQVMDTHRRAEIHFHKVRRSVNSYAVRVFLNLDDADAQTPIIGNDHYVGFFSRFGHGMCVGGPGHCDPPPPRMARYWRRPRHHNEHHHYRLDATKTIAKLKEQGHTDLHVNVVVLDGSGHPIEGLRMEALSLNFYD